MSSLIFFICIINICIAQYNINPLGFFLMAVIPQANSSLLYPMLFYLLYGVMFFQQHHNVDQVSFTAEWYLLLYD